MSDRVLFCAESVYQLFNAIVLRMTERKDQACDIVLSNATAWQDDMILRLRETGVFGSVFMPDTHIVEHRFWDWDLEKKLKAVEDPTLFFDDIPFEPVYQELFFPIDHMFWKMIYRYEVVNGLRPRIMMYDEGVRAYTMDLPLTDQKKYLAIDSYKAAPFVKAIQAYYLYQPDVYSVKDYSYELRQIPNPAQVPEAKKILLDVYGYERMPEEPYIYLEDFFFADAYITNDFDLFKQVVDLVGRENIIVKRHPRDKFDRFGPQGYKTVKQAVVPWEIQLLANDLRSKVLISVSSTSILTPYIIFDSDMHVISLEKMFVGENPTHKDAAFSTFFKKLKTKINEKEIRFHTPSSFDELREVIRYISLLQYNERGEAANG